VDAQTVHTPVDVLEPPFRSMQVLGDELLGGGRHRHILFVFNNKQSQWIIRYRTIRCTQDMWIVRTSGGRHSFACRRRTEKPPWVLVSDGVRILQKECTTGLGVSGRGGSGNVGRFTCCKTQVITLFFQRNPHSTVQCPKKWACELLCLQNQESVIYLQREEELKIQGIQMSKICRIQTFFFWKIQNSDLGTAPQIKDMLTGGERATTKKQESRWSSPVRCVLDSHPGRAAEWSGRTSRPFPSRPAQAQ